jgi:hypothetical protein
MIPAIGDLDWAFELVVVVVNVAIDSPLGAKSNVTTLVERGWSFSGEALLF